jgi:CRP/FNR family cyclic AMP-dependent transcriptional regulator
MPGKRTLAFSSATFLEKIASRRTSREYRNKESIFSQGDVADAMFYVEAGNVKLTVLSKRGKKAVIAIFRQGDFFGEGCLAMSSLRMSTATAVDLSTIVRVEKAIIIRIIHDDPRMILCSQGCSSRTCFRGLFGLKKTSSINS